MKKRSTTIIGILAVILFSCGVSKEDAKKPDQNQTKVDSAAYQKGVEKSVNEKLLKKYKK